MAALLCPFLALAQFKISGKVSGSNGKTFSALSGASVKLKNQGFTAGSNANGIYELSNLPAGSYTVVVSYLGYATQEKKVIVNADAVADFTLQQLSFVADEVVVSATRVAKNAAFTYKNLSKADLDKTNQGQDLPYLLNQTPSVVVTSDAGAGVGYTGIRIRGSDATRINVTLNGIPLNDAESQGSFFINLPDLASSVDNIQIQRGVGTSTNGAGAFGASLNIQTTTRKDSAYAELNNTYGSFETWRNTVSAGTGLINNKFSFDARLSRIKSDGYVDNASSDLKSFFVTGAYYGKNDILRVNVFSGTEKTYQAWNGISREMMETNRKYNSFTYDNQTDNYQQDHYQLFYTRNISKQLVANAALHYTYGRGYYEEFKEAQKLSKYKIDPVVVRDPATNNIVTFYDTSDLVRRLWLDNDFYGTTYSLAYTPANNLNFTLGGAYNRYEGKHFDEVVWAQFANYNGAASMRHRYDDNDAFKSDFNIFGRVNYQLDKLNIYADLQYRNVFYSFYGKVDANSFAQQNARLEFFNPKFGLTYNLTDQSNVYASVAVGNKEPNRRDFTDSNTGTRPKHESLTDIEFGYRTQQGNFNIGANGFAMLYKDQLINTGKLNEVGGQTRQNVPDSYRIGLELDARWQIVKNFSWTATATLSQSKIKNFTEYVNDDDENRVGEFLTFDYSNTNIAYSPRFIGSNEFAYTYKNAGIALVSKYVGEQNLDNTGGKDENGKVVRVLHAFFINDVRLTYNLKALGIKNIGLNFLVNNIFNVRYAANGGSGAYLTDGEFGRYEYFYPQATRNFLLSLNFKF
ncbi:TonB-dependent Receptor Plug Domain protein [compost metagenome]